MPNVEIIGNSKEVKNLIEVVKKIARNASITTLITGENGTGKELVAKLLHNLSENSDKPFIDINCGAIPEPLLESELFGHEKGSFTGAYDNKKGLLELAHGGTVFLDEITNTNTNFQSKLLKAVETKRFRRVGGIKEIEISTRIVAATNIDIQKAVKKGTFREDLYFRLNIGQINVPALRERGEDIMLLAHHFLATCNKEYGHNVKGFSEPALELIRKYPWPGNVRQLKNTIERAILIECEDIIKVTDLNLDYLLERITGEHSEALNLGKVSKDLGQFQFPTKGIALEQLEKEIILSALEKADGNLSYTARLLKISRGKLRYKMEKLDIEIPQKTE
jgi:two-component system response regulator AtoC